MTDETEPPPSASPWLGSVEVPDQPYQWNMRAVETPPGQERAPSEAWAAPPAVGRASASIHTESAADREIIAPRWDLRELRPPKPGMWGASIALVVAVGIPLVLDLVIHARSVPTDGQRHWGMVAIIGGAYLVCAIAVGLLVSEGRRIATILRGLWAVGLTAGCGLLLAELVHEHPLTFGVRVTWVALIAIAPLIIPWMWAGAERA